LLPSPPKPTHIRIYPFSFLHKVLRRRNTLIQYVGIA
jgi:hypothetical protein